MTRKTSSNAIVVILGSLGWPLIWGLAACTGFYVLVHQGVISNPLIHRYFAGHLVEYIETAMFCIGLAALAVILLDVLGQYTGLGRITLGPVPPHGQTSEQSSDLLDTLAELPARLRNSYLGRRLHDALELVERKGSAEGIEDELKYLADNDAARQHDRYGLARIIIWATPMLGFLGTVIGITMALAELGTSGANLGDGSSAESITGLLAGLSIAFDTTALALTLSITLMFIQFLIDRVETQLLSAVDARAAEELVGRFEQLGGGNDPYLSSIQHMNLEVLKSTEQLVQRQSQLWETTINAAHEKWDSLSNSSGEKLLSSLSATMDQTLDRHARHMAQVDQNSAEQLRTRWEQWQMVLSDNARTMHSQQKEMVRQGEIMSKVVQAVGEVKSLENVLNENLQSLSGAKNFENTVMSLAAAIHLLNTQLGASPDGHHSKIDLEKSPKQDRAA